MTPRKSFAAFSELVRGRAAPFSGREERIGEAIRQALIEVILRFANDATEERRRSTERQEVLIAELNHRVRNILALIRSLVTKTSQASTDVSSYVESLGGRVQALARAHDRVTKQSWGPTGLAGLFEDEIAAHDATSRRLTLHGPEVQLHPQAISTMALVVHELVTQFLQAWGAFCRRPCGRRCEGRRRRGRLYRVAGNGRARRGRPHPTGVRIGNRRTNDPFRSAGHCRGPILDAGRGS